MPTPIKISELAGAGALSGTETVAIVQSGATVRATTLQIAGLASASADLTVGSSAISSGTTTRVLYDNAGVLGEYSISGTGSVAMTTSPTFVTPTLGVASATSLSAPTLYVTGVLQRPHHDPGRGGGRHVVADVADQRR